MTRNGIRRIDAMTILTLRHAEPADETVDELSATVMSPLARCANSALDPDEWYPIATKPAQARAEAARALAVCAVCPVRAECLELSMRRWDTGGEHGIWGGLVEADRTAVRVGWRAGTPVTATITAEHG
jgi:WhiB family transcriptional regulator, redox-sensing transcriptional regulator